ncbi:heme lyase CcmF/NrfE family subunit [Reichenbachiella agariperforans]|uniref:heme lyase CcmF/NrfE family subunit n=1 Tax=Reichenbachiella agariperforans TaxID=156994 RepID=UPI001C08CA7C|nr:cytochrome c biogenesis protein CcsA [Reichenbachiella agariperforans]MBU2916066.1 cytochrome c biogenesis protein CcsA [Reichenbachiella agariperforans]
MHYFIGSLGHFLIIAAFVSALVSAYGYFRSVQSTEIADKDSWMRFARIAFWVHGGSALGVVATLFTIINRGYFEYHYAYSHSSTVLPVYYQISAFWEGQEGSFLLWIFWNVILGFVLIRTNKFWEAPVMAIFAIVQGFLLSMILGVVLFNLKIGSSPFILLRDAMDAPIFKTSPDFIPEDGSGLNPLLQNYWMVIHPPTLFLGFATTLIPFAYCIAGLWLGKFKEWIRPALPWSLFSAVVLGVGILMGGYWAYETLNFGGYWNWDPVENAVYVPWLVLIAAIHTMIAFKKSTTALKSAIILAVSAFLLIVYSTFLTRSGILGDSSVHSFTDLGLSGQLLVYLLAFVLGALFLIIRSWKKLESDEQEVSTYSREFWIFMGATVLCLMGFQVIIPTSIPVWNALVGLVGIDSNMAPPVDQVEYYTQYQLWGGVLIALLSGTGQFFWWNKMDKTKLKDALLLPIVLTLAITAAIIILFKVQNITYILVLTAGTYSIIANAKILLDRWKTNINLSGGAISHIGIAMMLLGVLFSSGYSKIVSLNQTGLVWSKEFPDEVNQKNLLLFQNEDRQMGEYSLNYKGTRKRIEGFPGYVNIHDINQINETQAIAALDLSSDEEVVFHQGDTLTLITPETSYFEIAYTKGETSFDLYPTVQINEKMNMTVFSPDIKRKLGFDLYTHVRTFPDPDQETDWSETEIITTQLDEPFFVNDFVATLEKVQRVTELDGLTLGEGDVAIKADIRVKGGDRDYLAEPYYIIKDNQAGLLSDIIHDLGIKLTITEIDPKSNSFKIGVNKTQKDWVILEAVEKPMINVLWIGTLVMVIGFIIAITRRYGEFVKMKEKGLES